jgi:low temperature requirement protein LtrA
MSAPLAEPETPTAVTTLELFFDLVFVFTITQLTSLLVHEPTWTGLYQVALMLGAIFWMYGGYAWLTNSVALDRLTRRLTLLGGMAGFLVVALAVPEAFTGSGTAFGLAYVAVVLVHLGMFARSSRMSVVQAMVRLAPFNLFTAALVLVGGVLGGTSQYVLWTAAVAIEWVSPKLVDDSGFVIEPAHFVERHGLVVIVAIGESVVAVGIGAAGLAVDAGLVASAVLGLALSACLWWSYFASDEDSAEAALREAPVERRPRLALDAYGYWHLLILLGVIAIAAGLKEASGHPFAVLPGAQALALGAGTAVFLLGEALFRNTLGIGSARGRALTAALALVTIPIGSEIAAAAQLAVLVGMFVAMLSPEAVKRARIRPSPRPGSA